MGQYVYALLTCTCTQVAPRANHRLSPRLGAYQSTARESRTDQQAKTIIPPAAPCCRTIILIICLDYDYYAV